MAIFLSSSQSSTLEPLRKNRWVMQFTTVPGSANGPERLAFCAHTATQPQQTYNTTEHHRLNERFYTAGKVTWNQISATFYDFIEGPDSAGEILWNWSNSIYNPITGQMFFKKQYMTSATLALLDPAGGVIRAWNLFYIWPSDVNWGDLSSEDDGPAEVAVTFHYDYAVKSTDVDTTPI